MKLIIVESPSKCKKILSILGKTYSCMASVGHIYEIRGGLKGIQTPHYLPDYSIIKGKQTLIKKLRSACQRADVVYLATDPDREGEAIAYHLCLCLGLSVETTPRVRFHELTPSAVKHAFDHPRCIDMNLVRAQQARQVLDLYIGYRLSPFLWKHVGPRLSAGRCQSPALRWIWEREQQILQSDMSSFFFLMTADFSCGLSSCLLQQRFSSEQEALDALEFMKKENHYVVHLPVQTTKMKSPPPPFITSSIQKDLYQHFGITPTLCMNMLQRLYEKGKITYMRTDNTHLSPQARQDCRKKIESLFGISLWEERQFSSRTKHSQDAHEAIRPTRISDEHVSSHVFSPLEQQVYHHIWKRTIASQMTSHVVDIQERSIDCGPFLFIHTFPRIREMGWKQVYHQHNVVTTAIDVPTTSFSVQFRKGQIIQKFLPVPSHYSMSTLIQALESKGIGRPSTFASIGEKLLQRNYVSLGNVEGHQVSCLRMEIDNSYTYEKHVESVMLGKETNKYVMTELGRQVVHYLSSTFPLVLDDLFTSLMEKDLETILQDPSHYFPVLNKHIHQFEQLCQEAQHAKKNERKGIKGNRVPQKDGSTVETMSPFYPSHAREERVSFADDPS